MPYVFVEDFKGGQDRRKARVSGTPGTLWDCINAHITRGGEIEKRKAFVATYSLPAGTFGMATTSTAIYVFGSAADPGVPSGVTYQRLQHPDGLAMAAVLDAKVTGGQVYVAAEYSDDSVHHFYNGTRVADWDDGVVRAAMTDNDGIATHLAALIDASALYAASAAGATITITAATAGVPFTIDTLASNVTGGTDDQTLTENETQANITGTAEVLAEGSFQVTGGTSSAGVNKLSSVTVDGIEIMSGAVDWATSNSTTAVNIAANITAHTSTPNYTAVAEGSTVVISAVAGSGADPNGFVVVPTVGGNLTVGSVVNMAGGVDSSGNQAQIVEVVVGGTFEVGDRFTITLQDVQFGVGGNPSPKGRVLLPFKTKMYAGAGAVLAYSSATDVTAWNADEDAGAGFETIDTQFSDSAEVTGLGIYEGTNLAVFSDRTIQTWFVEVDESLNSLLRVLPNVGTRAAGSIVSFGTSDVFFLDDSGIRSLRARDSSGAPFASDVGSAIDPLVIAFLATLTDDEIAAAHAIVDPLDGRYWLAVGTNVFVFSYFVGAKISAWSTYELPGAVEAFGTLGKRIYARIGDTIYLYGGADNATYDASVVTVGLPYLDAEKPAHEKELMAFDAAVTNTWDVKIKVDPNDEDLAVHVGTIDSITYGIESMEAVGAVTHFAPLLVCEQEGPATISNLCVHYKMADAD